MMSFAKIQARAAKRKGGDAALAQLIPAAPDLSLLDTIGDDQILSAMAKCIFRAGFVWRIIDHKWPGFEAAFLEFQPGPLCFQPDEFWHDLASDKRIVRHAQKIKSVHDNALFVQDIAAEHGSFGAFLEAWPQEDQAGLMAFLSKRGSRLGGASGQYLLRMVGWDAFILSRDVVAAIHDAGVEVAEMPTSKGDLAKIQAQFNVWRKQSGLSATQMSRILAFSIGENYDQTVSQEDD
ncbi:MAG: DNA-3-methyladenine glycosylase I [Alphaproteobacteria bacterium]|nr:DNA-3-methyladenine glycosylase I [Alphaproteobacteria bacterium]